jgi:23S rRNA (cytidine1920-2'-O)/16S rRNA (cytidine1409-2'-O)-methyltransferase
VDDDEELTLERPPRFVSRGGEKLEHALEVLGLDVRGRDALDVGASTGGFTDVLLQRGRRAWSRSTWATASCTRACATTRGHGARADERAGAAELPFAPDLVVADVSFISVRTALPPALALARPGWEALVLVKPQFEAGRRTWGRAGSSATRKSTAGCSPRLPTRPWAGEPKRWRS